VERFGWRHIDQPNHDVGYIQYPASVPAALTATVTATSITDSTKSATLQIKVNPLPAVTMTSIAAATAGTAYNAALTASGGTSPYTWSVNPTTLPRD